MASRYAIQHEFDYEPTYVVHDGDAELNDEDCIAFGSNLPVQLRLRMAQMVCDELNGMDGGQQLQREHTSSTAPLAAESTAPPEVIRDPATLSHDALVRFAQRIQAAFYLDIQGEREFWNPDKEWEGADLLDELAQVLQQFGLGPSRITDAQP